MAILLRGDDNIAPAVGESLLRRSSRGSSQSCLAVQQRPFVFCSPSPRASSGAAFAGALVVCMCSICRLEPRLLCFRFLRNCSGPKHPPVRSKRSSAEATCATQTGGLCAMNASHKHPNMLGGADAVDAHRCVSSLLATCRDLIATKGGSLFGVIRVGHKKKTFIWV